MYQVNQADVIEWANAYHGEPFHALLCDPPYELNFMNRKWDNTGISFRKETWEAFARIMYPGAFGMAFGGARTAHRIAVAIEDAGFIIHPMIGWVYGSGFPKATRLDTKIDDEIHRLESGISILVLKEKLIDLFNKSGKTRGQIDAECGFRACNYLSLPNNNKRPDPWVNILPSQEKWLIMKSILGCSEDISQELDRLYEKANREIIGQETKARKTDCGIALPTQGETEYQTWDITLPATDLAKAWAGHRYGRQALKPAMEPIILFQKPYAGRPIDSITASGAGALNIDDSRIGTDAVISNRWTDNAHPSGGGAGNEYETVHNVGRWPANVVLSHHPDCKLRDYLDDEENGETFAVWECVDGCAVKQMGEQGGIRTSGKPMGIKKAKNQDIFGDYKTGNPVTGFGDSGTAARYFYNADWMYERIEEDDGFLYCAKANRTERDAGMREERNHHPSVKPIALMQHLATLLLPPGMYAPRRILVPFSGSGSEMIGCLRAGYEHIDGIEYEQEYCEIARARLEYWRKIPIQRQLLPNP